jgi:hypothetical protein
MTRRVPGATAGLDWDSRWCGEIVELHGGSVRATSGGHNKGAAFSIELPMLISPDADRSHPDAAAAGRKNETALKGVRVLVVEDESDARTSP